MANAEQAVAFIILQGGTSTSLVKCHKMHTSVGVKVFFNSNVLFCNSYRTESCKGREKSMTSFSLFSISIALLNCTRLCELRVGISLVLLHIGILFLFEDLLL